MSMTDIKNRIISVFLAASRTSQFFKDEHGTLSMGRLLSFILIVTICFDAIWTLTILRQMWDFSFNKMLIAMTALSVKTASLFIERWAATKTITTPVATELTKKEEEYKSEN